MKLRIYVESDFLHNRSARIIRFHKTDAYINDDAVKKGTRIKIDKMLWKAYGDFWALEATIKDKKNRRNGQRVTFHAVKVELI